MCKILLLHFLFLGFICYAAEPLTLPTIQVNPTPVTAEHHKSSPSAIDFNQTDLQQQTASSLTNFLKKQSLLKIESHASLQNQSAISLHGFGTNASTNTLLLIDGIPISSFTDIGPNLDSILIPNIQSITVIPGSYGTQYGDQAVGGVVDIETTIPKKRKAQVGVAIGNEAQRQADFFISDRTPSHLGYSIAAQGSHTDHLQAHNAQDNYVINTKLDYAAARDLISLNFIGYNTSIQVPPPLILGDPTPQPITNNHTNIEGNFVYLKNKGVVNDSLLWNTHLSFMANQAQGLMNIPYHTDQHDALFQNSWEYKNLLTTGVDLQQDQYNLLNTVFNRNVHDQVADTFAHVTLPVTDKTQFITGARLAKQWVNASLTPGVQTPDQSQVLVNEQSILWHMSDTLEFYARRDMNYRFAKADEKIWVPTNITDLKTQTGIAYETGINWQKSQAHLSIMLYQLNLNNEIAFNPMENPPFGQMYNLPPTQRLGIDVTGITNLTYQTLLNTQLSLVNPKITAAPYQNKIIPSVSPISAGVGLTYLGEHAWTANITQTYHSSFFAADDIANQGPKLGSYFLTDLVFTKLWNTLNFSFQIDNLFNKEYARFADFEDGLIEYYPDDGITVLAGIRVDLM